MANRTIVENGTSVPLLQLNYDCLLELFKYLGFKECMHLAEAYEELQCVADWTYKTKCAKFTYNFTDAVELVFYHIGPFVRSLTLIMDNVDCTERNLQQIHDACSQLKELTLVEFDRRTVVNMPFSGRLDSLSLERCSLADDEDFFLPFNNLKTLNISRCRDISSAAIKKCFEDNSEIQSFTCDSQYLPHSQLLSLLPDIEQLRVSIRINQVKLRTSKKLRNLTLECLNRSPNETLTDLALNNNVEKLVLHDAQIDENTFDRISALDKLQFLALTTFGSTFHPAAALPPKLKCLQLGGFEITQATIRSLIKDLKYLEVLHLADCALDCDGNFDAIAESMVRMLSFCKSREINLILTDGRDRSLEVYKNVSECMPTGSTNQINFLYFQTIVTQDGIRITNYIENPNIFEN